MSQTPTCPLAGSPPNTGGNPASALPAPVVTNDSITYTSGQAASTSNAADENGPAAPLNGQFNTEDSEFGGSNEEDEEYPSSEGSLQDYRAYGYQSESDTDPDSDSETEAPEFGTCAICSRRLAKMCLLPCDHHLCSPCLIGMWWARIAMPHQWPVEIRCPFCRSECARVMDGEGVPFSVLGWVMLYSENAMFRLLAEEVGVEEPAVVRPFLLHMRTLFAQG